MAYQEDGIVRNIGSKDHEKSVVTGYGEVAVQGKRWEMEDAHIIIPAFRGNSDEFFAGVYDGHAGKIAADFISLHLHENLSSLLETHTPEEALREAFLLTDRQIQEQGITDGATVVTAYLKGSDLYIANAGDARAVLGRRVEYSELLEGLRLSHDHKADDPDEVTRIESLGGYVTSSYETGIPRVNGRLAIARAIGDHDGELEGYVSAEPYISKTNLMQNDGLLILACDGVWDVISDNEAVQLIRNVNDPQLAAETLKDEALRKESRDNVSAIVINLNASGGV